MPDPRANADTGPLPKMPHGVPLFIVLIYSLGANSGVCDDRGWQPPLNQLSKLNFSKTCQMQVPMPAPAHCPKWLSAFRCLLF
jgi:hypothetical protein